MMWVSLSTAYVIDLSSNVVVNGGPARCLNKVRRFRPVRSTCSWASPGLPLRNKPDFDFAPDRRRVLL